MKAFLLLLVAVACYATAAVEKDDGSFQVAVEHRSVHKDVLRARQARRLAKWGKAARALPKYHTKFLEENFRTDFILGNVSMGTPIQGPFSVILSTGATRLWLASDDVEHITSKHHTYYPSNSDTYNNLNKVFNNVDGSFNSTGKWYSDVFEFGRAKIKGQAFGYVDTIVEENNIDFPADGVLGINHLSSDAYTGTNAEPTAPIDNLLHPLIKKVVSIFIDKQVPPSKGSAKGAVTIGALDKTNCNPSGTTSVYIFTYRTGYDSRQVIYVNNLQYDTYSSAATGYAYFDTGISTLQLPTDDLGAIYNLILPDYDWDTGLYTVSCDSISQLKSIYIELASISYIQIDPQNFVVDLGLDGGACALSLEIVGDGNQSEQYILGTPFFRQSCVSLDFDNNELITYPHKT